MPSSGRPAHLPYALSAEVYDRVYAWKDYAAEARRIRSLVRRYGPSGSRTLLDVACGTGAHARHLARWFHVTGVDASPAMLAVARRAQPGTRFVRGRMESFRLSERFDVVTCLFSAIGYVRSRRELERTVRNFAAHLKPGGVVLVEPWLTPTAFRAGSMHLGVYGSKRSPIVRMNSSVRRGDRSILELHYLAGIDGAVHSWTERHDLALFDDRTVRRAFVAAGLRVRRIPSHFTTRRGLYVGVRPLPPEPRRGRARATRAHVAARRSR